MYRLEVKNDDRQWVWINTYYDEETGMASYHALLNISKRHIRLVKVQIIESTELHDNDDHIPK